MLVCESLGKLATVALALHFELEQIVDADAAIAANAIEQDLSAVEELVEMSATHAESLSCLTRGDGLRAVNDNDFVAVAHAATQAH